MRNILYPTLSAISFSLALYGMADSETLVMIAGAIGAWYFGTQDARG